MVSADSRERVAIIAMGLLLLLAPAMILVITLEILILLGDLELSDISFVEFLELYVIEVIVFAVVAYAIYRLTLWVVETRLPTSIDALQADEADESRAEISEPSDDR